MIPYPALSQSTYKHLTIHLYFSTTLTNRWILSKRHIHIFMASERPKRIFDVACFGPRSTTHVPKLPETHPKTSPFSQKATVFCLFSPAWLRLINLDPVSLRRGLVLGSGWFSVCQWWRCPMDPTDDDDDYDKATNHTRRSHHLRIWSVLVGEGVRIGMWDNTRENGQLLL